MAKKEAEQQPKAAADPTDGLAEPGYQRREELRQRADGLMVEAERLMNEYERESIDPSKLDPAKVDREVRQAVNDSGEVFVSNANPNYRYVWIYRDPQNRFGGRFAHAAKAVGFEVVSGDLPEASEHRAVTGERWVADCLLMRIRLDHYAKLQLRDREKRLRQQMGVSAGFFDAAERSGIRAFDHTNMPERYMGHMAGLADMRNVGRPQRGRGPQRRTTIPPARVQQANAVRQLTADKLTHQIKTGTVSGLDPQRVAARR